MPDIGHHVGINAPAPQIYQALASTDGLRQWWTRTVEGESTVGETLKFFFRNPEPSAVMEVVALEPESRVEWRCAQGPDEWVGTTLTFELIASEDGETFVRFTHANWTELSDFMRHCSTKWAYFLLGMKALLEGGPSVAFPDDAPISSWG